MTVAQRVALKLEIGEKEVLENFDKFSKVSDEKNIFISCNMSGLYDSIQEIKVHPINKYILNLSCIEDYIRFYKDVVLKVVKKEYIEKNGEIFL